MTERRVTVRRAGRRVARWLPWVLLVAAAAVALAIGASHGGPPPSIDAETMHIAGEVRCPVCEGQTAAQSQAPASVQIRDQIHQELAAGEKQGQILNGLVASYGQGILETPRASGAGLVVWVLPVVIVAAALGALLLAFRRWRPAAAGLGERRLPSAAALRSRLPQRGGSRLRWVRWGLIGVGVSLVAAGAAWAVVGSSSSRLPGEEITGASLAPDTVSQQLQTAQQDQDNGNAAAAVKVYQAILTSDPGQPDALTGEGWILAETGEPSLVRQGVDMLSSAEKASPSYLPAHLYRGVALLSEKDYAAAIPELRWYLAHDPTPNASPAPSVRAALAQAEAQVKPPARR